jgi:hypothetical protein
MLGIQYFKKAETRERKNYFLGLSVFFILLGISRVVFIYHDFFAPDYIGSIHLDVVLWKIGNIIQLAGFTIISYIIETYIYKKTKHFITIIGMSFTILYGFMMDKNIATIFLYIADGSMLFLPFLIYLITTLKTKGVIRKRASIILFGLVIVLVGSAIGILVLIGLVDKSTSLILGNPIMLFGFIIVFYGFIQVRFEEKSETDLLRIKEMKDDESKISMIETLTGFRPQDLTEEEVTFYREQKICLVCKGKAGGFNIFVCITCDALYCQKCARVLSQLENACWLCNSAIDDSKPVKLQAKEREEVEVTGKKTSKED